MFRRLLKLALAAGVLLFFGFVALVVYVVCQQVRYKHLADTHALKGQVEAMGTEYVSKRRNAALVIGVLQRGNRYIEGFGQINSANATPPNGQTLFEIGSVTKVFTALTLAKMANDGVVELDDPISRLLPEGVACPQKNGRQITPRHLATHTAGLPRLPDNFDATVKDGHNPYATYKAADLYQSLQTVRLASEPGKKSAYSNYGFGLLGHLLELKAGKPYQELVKQTVCAPLAMSNTVIDLSSEQKTRLTPGHDPKGAPVTNWVFDVLAGCGAFYSDAEDLLKFIEANLNPPASALSNALAEAQKFHFKEFSGGVGLGWQIQEPLEGQILQHWHNGGTGGYVSFVGFDKAAQVGVVILSNYGDAWAGDTSVDRIGMQILKFAPKISWE